jgi:signal peptidase I
LDFALILVILTATAGVVWLLDLLLLKRARIEATAAAMAVGGTPPSEPIIVEYAKSFFPILLLVLVIRSFLFEPFRIPSESMMPTLSTGDFIFVNKFAYGLRLPVVNTKILQIGEPQHGDVVVFRLPSDPKVDYIKRIVGLPGDVVDYVDESKRLTINGEPVTMEVVGPAPGNDPDLVIGREKLGEHDHELLLRRGPASRGGTYVVPPGHYFVMGDSRDNSKDSRYDGVEYIPEGNLVGRAVRIWMNWRWPRDGGPQWSRIGKSIE